MKRFMKFYIAAALFLVAFSGWATEMSALWSNLYREADTLERKYAVMSKIVQENDRDLIPLMTEAQDELLRISRDIKTAGEGYLHSALQKMIIQKLGDLKAAEASDILYKTAVEAADVFLKADAVRALGKVGAFEFAPQVAMFLRNINLDAVVFASMEERETMVLACVSALERMKAPEGFEPVFFAATGRYSREVLRIARQSLEKMVEDPTEPLLSLIKNYSDYNIKLQALEFARNSKAPAAGKTAIAAEGLNEGMAYAVDDPREKLTLSRIRTASCLILIENGYDDPEISGSLGDMLAYVPKETGDLNELLVCLQALGVGRVNESAAILSAHLKKLNDLQVRGITITDQREVKATIQALGNTGNTIARPELTRVQFCNWNSAVNREALAALDKLP